MKMFKFIAILLTMCVMFVEGDGGSGGSDTPPAGSDTPPAGSDTPPAGDTLYAGKYKTVDELVTGYTELNTAFSGKDQAHKEAMESFKTPDEFTAGEGWGSDNAMDNRMMAVFQEVAKEHNMSQAMYESLVVGMTDMQSRVESDNLVEVQKSIPNFEARAKAMADSVLGHMRPDQAKALDQFVTNKEAFEAFEIILASSRGSQLPQNTNAPADLDPAQIRQMVKELNPSDTVGRAKLMELLNAQGDGNGRMV